MRKHTYVTMRGAIRALHEPKHMQHRQKSIRSGIAGMCGITKSSGDAGFSAVPAFLDTVAFSRDLTLFPMLDYLKLTLICNIIQFAWNAHHENIRIPFIVFYLFSVLYLCKCQYSISSSVV